VIRNVLIAGLLTASAAAAVAAPAGSIVKHPNDLKFAPLKYDAPRRDEFRHVLSNGVPVYVVEDHGLPLANVSVTVRGGDYLDPADKAGLATITANQIRSGGAGDMDADAFDQAVDFLAMNFMVGSSARESSAGVNVLSKDLEKALDLLFSAMRNPRFQQDRIDLYKSQTKQQLERRNDSTTTIETREWRRLMYGDDTFESRLPTTTSTDSITRQDLVDFHRKVWVPANMIVAVTGDVKTADVLATLEKRFAGWAVGTKSPDVPAPTHVAEPGVFLINKDDVNQTRVSIGHRSVTWDDPRWASLEIMNEILGGGGFTSRITRRVRSDEGLAYSAGSGIAFGRTHPQSFRVVFQSKNMSVAQAIDLSLQEIDRIRKEPVTTEELETAKNAYVETFPQRFSSAQEKAGVFVDDELTGRPPDWWEKWRPAIQAVDAKAVQSAAQTFLQPDKLTILAVGKVDEVLAGNPDKPDHSLSKTAAATGIKQIPLPNPATLAYPSEPTVLIAPSAPQPTPKQD
jgi:zinc protease